MKKIISMFLSFLIITLTITPNVFADEIKANALAVNGKTINISGVNRSIQVANEIILFTRNNSSKLTDTNIWCAAASVNYVDGKYIITDITDRKGAVTIPNNGFVLFGHGTSEDWILSNLKIGEELNIEGYTLPQVILDNMIELENGERHIIDNIDKERESNKLQIYTTKFGQYTQQFSNDTEEVKVSNNIVVEKNNNGNNGTYIPGNGYVISGSGNSKDFVDKLQIGQKVSLVNIDIPVLPNMYFRVNNIIGTITKKNTERGAGEVIFYDSSFGSSTKANPWGMEITEVDGKITNITSMLSQNGTFIDNNSTIPVNGHVISIHSDNAVYGKLKDNVKVGDNIEIVTDNINMYNANKTSFNALNPRTYNDNSAGWDVSNDKPFPGFRGADQLIIYDSSYGKTTGTNEWGYEVVVNSDNKVIKIGGNNTSIPKGDLVLSGHGIQADWLKNNALMGSSIMVDKDKKEVTSILTPESFIDSATFKIAAIKDELNAAKEKFLDIPYDKVQAYINNADSLLTTAKNDLENRNFKEMLNVLNNIENEVNNAYFTNYESKSVDNRAVWIRPKETDVKQVIEHLDKLKALNINTIYLETWWGGYTIFPTQNKITTQNPIYKGFDVLNAYLTEAHKRGIEIHSWVENFFIGDSGVDNGGPVYKKKPEWLLTSRKGDKFQYVAMYKVNYYFANPALPEARDFVMSIYSELIKKYNIDGLQLDYVRYPDAGDGTNDYGYDAYTRDLFKKANGVDPITIFPGDDLWNKWCEFRANIINTFVYRVVSEVKALKPNINISADVWPNYEQGPSSMMQEPKKWVSKGYIDNIIPMSYSTFTSAVTTDTSNTIAFANGHAYSTVGLGTSMGLTKVDFLNQVGAAYDSGADGTALFEYESLMSAGYGNELVKGLYRNAALVGAKDPLLSVNTILSDMTRKIDKIYYPSKGINLDTKNILNSGITSIKKISKGKRTTPIASQIKAAIEKFKNTIKNSKNVNNEVKNRMINDLKSCTTILINYIQEESFAGKHLVDHYTLEAPVKGTKIGDLVQVKVKAVFKDAKDVIMYLDPSQYTIKSTNTNVMQVKGGYLIVKGHGKTDIIVNISKKFIYNIDKKEKLIKQNISF